MKCRNCAYPLWQLPARRCPECGAGYKPSDYEFAPNSVEFCCPHCQHPHLGTKASGLLEEAEFDCASCGRHISMDDMILRPAPGIREEHTEVPGLPWLDRHRRGRLAAWLATVGIALANPSRLMRNVPAHSSTDDAFRFLVLNVLLPIPILLSIAPAAITAVAGILTIAFPTSSVFTDSPALVRFILVGGVILAGATLWASATHLLLRLTGPTAGSIRRTRQAIYYSSGANLTAMVPCVGYYLGWIWWLISAVFAVSESQRVSRRRAALAVLGPPICCLALGFAYTLNRYDSVMTRARQVTLPSVQAFRDIDKLTQAILSYAKAHRGRGPDHAIRLATEGDLVAMDFISSDSNTTLDQIPFAGATLEQLFLADMDERTRLVTPAIAALPRRAVAHRLGDYVFTYEGMDLARVHPHLWIVVEIPDPGANPVVPAQPVVHQCGLANGTIYGILSTSFPTDLAAQNTLRATYGLPPLPNLRNVTHTQSVASRPAETPE